MELQLMMDGGAETLHGTMWFSNTSPSYEQLSPVRPNRCDVVANSQQTTLGYHSPQNSLWQDKHSPKNSPTGGDQIHLNSSSPQQLSPSGSSPNCEQNNLKRRSTESDITELEKKHIRRDGSIGSNGSGQGWSTQVEELAEHLAADFDGSLSALAASDLATAVASYTNMSEALLTLPSLTVFKQEAPSPENQHNNPNLNHVSQRAINTVPTSNGNVGSVEADSNNNGQTAASLHQLLYSSNEEYPPTSTATNHVSSSQQGNELNEDCRFQYVLAAATSIATKVNEETLTYLNQGQSYEIKLKKLGDLSAYRGKILKGHSTFLFQSTIRICFHERRLQYTEREQMLAWQRARPGERLLEVDVPLSYGMVDVCQPSLSNNSVEFMWDPTKEVGVYIKVNCISTEFTPKKHGGEKGVPFRIQVETRLPGGPRLHAASCQVKVFKLKGADRKHKQDRDKILRRPPHEQDKYQPSYDCTVLSDIPLESLSPSNLPAQNGGSPYASTDAISPQTRTTIGGNSSPVVAPLALSVSNSGIVPLVPASDAVKENVGTAPALPSPAAILPDQPCIEADVSLTARKATSPQQLIEFIKTGAPCLTELPPDANATQTTAWLRASRFNAFESTFASFSASDILRLSREDLIQICGVADGIRLFNTLHSKAPTPKLTLYFSLESNGSLWRVAYLDSLTSTALTNKLLNALNLPHDRLHSILFLGPQGIHVLVTDELVANMKDESMYLVETIKDPTSERYKLLIKSKII
ncbi:transcription factor CP2-like protein 1 isoform X1 [Mycetomoellerius zeteki]|uniref:transcription factor CP2-like protein 1 isoform X1 n=1 Tax=Mycetomoellerius zeteki TaxID=64791 RepID=UPI00084EAE11|nr:PREDICTED: transcription factor CP2-like protein 1 isoform X1 [Trachymyrmex zeteki]XP_018313085.1 PREDICTED: transcription factor CP2-like protein 1 isoform X1 [Trachymyrmex zeteki]